MRQFMKPERIRIIAVLAIFNYIFLGSEYLFDNMIRYATDSAGVVRAQNYVLGISVIGFLLFPCINRYFNQKMREIGLYLLPIAGIICIFVIQEHLSYRSMLLSGFLLYILYGMIGSAVHYYAVVSLSTEKGLAQTVGFGYAFGLLLQFISNNLIHNSTVESVALSVFLAAMVLLVRRLSLECSRGIVGAEASGTDSDIDIRKNNRRSLRHPMLAALLLISIVVLMTCIFSSLDNAVTLVHAGGSVDIGQWPRLLLAVSGLLAGVLFDIKEHRFMQIMMYCVTLLSTMCVVIIVWGGPFMAGLIVFYLSAGFFVVYFTTSFMDLSYYMKVPELWAGQGMAFVEFDGYIKEYMLQPGQSIIVDTGYLAAMDSSCSIDIQTVPGLKNIMFGGEGVFNTVVTGPGRVFLQSMPISQMAGCLRPYLPSGK